MNRFKEAGKQPSAKFFMTTDQILADLKALGDPAFKAGLGKFGINPATALGIKLPVLRHYAKAYRKNHALALDLWETKVHEARLMAVFIADPKQVTEAQMEKWVSDFNSWDICDQACGGLFDKTSFAWDKAREWARREAEYEKRAGYALMAYLAIHDKKARDEQFLSFFPLITSGAGDDRNFVKKAVNWALRQMGKRNLVLHRSVLALAREIKLQNSRSARWIAADALRELQSPAVLASLQKKEGRLQGL
jgi:3-methyladenine DNA glycosylase AlkD